MGNIIKNHFLSVFKLEKQFIIIYILIIKITTIIISIFIIIIILFSTIAVPNQKKIDQRIVKKTSSIQYGY